MSIFKKASDCDHLVGGLTTVTIADPVPFLADPPWFAVISHLAALSDTVSPTEIIFHFCFCSFDFCFKTLTFGNFGVCQIMDSQTFYN